MCVFVEEIGEPGGNVQQETLELNPKPSCYEVTVLTATWISSIKCLTLFINVTLDVEFEWRVKVDFSRYQTGGGQA